MRKSGCACVLMIIVTAQVFAQSPASTVVKNAAEALGGQARILSLRTLKVEGYGQEAVQSGGGNDSASVDAPQRWTNILDYEQTIDLQNRRTRIRQRNQAWLAAATLGRVLGNGINTSVLDGDIPYTVSPEGQAR